MFAVLVISSMLRTLLVASVFVLFIMFSVPIPLVVLLRATLRRGVIRER
jgi:hypothetical protein